MAAKARGGSVGRFGPRYGVKIRRAVRAVEELQKATYKCPRCDFVAVKRYQTGVWRCRHCGLKFAGGAYTPSAAELTGLAAKLEKKAAPKEGEEAGAAAAETEAASAAKPAKK